MDKKHPFLTDENGEVRGKVFMASTIIKDSNSNDLFITENQAEYFREVPVGTEVSVASSNDRAKIVSISGNMVKIDRRVKSANSNIVIKGEILIFRED